MMTLSPFARRALDALDLPADRREAVAEQARLEAIVDGYDTVQASHVWIGAVRAGEGAAVERMEVL
jgi:hypothetical protein